jgi:hypothetical protein
MAYNYKGKGAISATYAQGGPVITTNSRFLKTPNQFCTDTGVPQEYGKSGKGGKLAKTEGDAKSLTPIKPRT